MSFKLALCNTPPHSDGYYKTRDFLVYNLRVRLNNNKFQKTTSTNIDPIVIFFESRLDSALKKENQKVTEKKI